MHTQTVEAFLLIEQPRQRLSFWSQTLAALDAQGAPRTTAIVAYYDPTCDQALLDLQYDARSANMAYVADVARIAEIVMVQPGELSEGERVRFLADRLTRCTIRVTAQRTAIGALAEIARKIRDSRNSSSKGPPPLPARGAKARAEGSGGWLPQGHDDVDAPVRGKTAEGTRDDVKKFPLMRGGEPPPPPLMRGASPRAQSPRAQSPTTPLRGPEPPPPPRRAEDTSERTREQLHALLASADRHTTVPMPADLSEKLTRESSKLIDLDALVPPTRPPVRHGAGGTLPGVSTESRAVTPVERGAPTDLTQIYARYLRGGRWVAVRVGALSLKGAALLTGALPRVDDRVDLALIFGPHRAIVRGRVGKVSSMREATSTGASTFSMAFDLDSSSRRHLTKLLLAARDARITIKPPPPRATRRFPVEWNVALGTLRGAVKSVALDVSTYGMFVKPERPLEVGATLTFSVMLDDGQSPIAGRARVVRQINETDAKAHGLAPGYGLVVVSMSESDRMRWSAFLARIERRADKRVLIGADAARLAELQAHLAGLGYAVTGGTDPGALVQLANADDRPADAVLIDAGWLQNEASATLVENVFNARNVPCVTMHGEARRARQAIDRLLEVVV